MNVLSKEKQVQAVAALAEGSSIRSVERMTGIHRDTIMRLGVRIGEGCTRLMDEKMTNLECRSMEVDELWGFIKKKKKNTTPEERNAGIGDAWTYLAIDSETKLIPSFLVGKRDRYHACVFMEDLARRLKNRVQLSSDAMAAYPEAIERAFGVDIDYGQVVKEYASKEETSKYNPLVSVTREVICGQPKRICTSYIERANLSLRTHCKRLHRLTIAFSKKPENFKAAIGLHLAYYNFIKIHSAIRCTPAMASGVESRVWNVEDLIDAS